MKLAASIRRRIAVSLLPVAIFAGCSAQTGPSVARTASTETALESSLVELGSAALARGEIDTAEARFQRALEARPGSSGARVGLAAVARARGDTARQREWLEEALERDTNSVDAMIALAVLERETGDAGRGRVLLERALEQSPGRADAHRELAELTGPAPRGSTVGPEQAGHRARAHPYDPWAGLEAARAFLAAGDRQGAVSWIRSTAWMADLDPASALAALQLLRELDEQWAERRIVPVHCFADQSLRRDPAWKMRLRLLWSSASASLAPLIDTVFVPVSFAAFSSAAASDDLDAIDRAFLAATPSPPAAGLVAVFTGRQPPRRSGRWRLGQAEFLGRRLVVRLEPESATSRTLLHEVLHLYGGVHVADDFESLLNPGGDALTLDRANARIIGLVRQRRFGPGGLTSNVMPFVESEALVAAYEESLRFNLAARRHGVLEALEARETSRFQAAHLAREASQLDSHLADVSRFVALLLIGQERFQQAAGLLEVAARLYGPRTQRGREAQARAQILRKSSPAPSEESRR